MGVLQTDSPQTPQKIEPVQTTKTTFNVTSANNVITLTNDDYQRLAFYLSSVNCCIPGLVEEPLRSYKNYQSFPHFIKEEIYLAAIRLKPALFEGKAFFLTPGPTLELIQPGVRNTHLAVNNTEKVWINLSHIDRAKGINSDVATKVDSKMLYTPEWLDINYNTPIANIERKLFKRDHVTVNMNLGSFASTNHSLSQPLNTTSYRRDSDGEIDTVSRGESILFRGIILFGFVIFGAVCYWMFTQYMKAF